MHGMNIQVAMSYFTRSGDVIFLIGGNNSCLKHYQAGVMLRKINYTFYLYFKICGQLPK